MLSTHVSRAPLILTASNDALRPDETWEALVRHVNRFPTRAERHVDAPTGSVALATQVTAVKRFRTQCAGGMSASIMHSTQRSVEQRPVTGWI